jgi:hypothetical protein
MQRGMVVAGLVCLLVTGGLAFTGAWHGPGRLPYVRNLPCSIDASRHGVAAEAGHGLGDLTCTLGARMGPGVRIERQRGKAVGGSLFGAGLGSSAGRLGRGGGGGGGGASRGLRMKEEVLRGGEDQDVIKGVQTSLVQSLKEVKTYPSMPTIRPPKIPAYSNHKPFARLLSQIHRLTRRNGMLAASQPRGKKATIPSSHMPSSAWCVDFSPSPTPSSSCIPPLWFHLILRSNWCTRTGALASSRLHPFTYLHPYLITALIAPLSHAILTPCPPFSWKRAGACAARLVGRAAMYWRGTQRRGS